MKEHVKLRAMVFAAGFGERMGSLSEKLPKALLGAKGKPMLGLILDKLYEFAGDRHIDIVVNCHHFSCQIKDFLKKYPKVLISEEQEILGTGGGLKKGFELLGISEEDPILTINSDTIWFSKDLLKTMLETWTNNTCDLLMLFYENDKSDFFVSEDCCVMVKEKANKSNHDASDLQKSKSGMHKGAIFKSDYNCEIGRRKANTSHCVRSGLNASKVDLERDNIFVFEDGKMSINKDSINVPYIYSGLQILRPRVVKSMFPTQTKFSLSEMYQNFFFSGKKFDKIRTMGVATKCDIYHLGSLVDYQDFVRKHGD